MHPQRSTNEILLKPVLRMNFFIAYFFNIKDVPSLILWTELWICYSVFFLKISKHINGDIYFTLKDPTPPEYNLKTVEQLEKKGFPSISVVAEDFAGLRRELRLFFRVNDRNLDVKVLENNIK